MGHGDAALGTLDALAARRPDPETDALRAAHQARTPETSMAQSRIRAMPAACGTGTMSAMTGTMMLEVAPAKPPLPMAEIKTAGMAME